MDGQAASIKESSSSHQQTELVVNSEYWYEERDIQQLLEYRIGEFQSSLEKTIFIAPCLDNAVHYGLKTYLEDEAKEHALQRQRHLLIPYNIGFCHWVGLYLHLKGQRISVTYMDPLTAAPLSFTEQNIWELSVPNRIKEEILAVYPNAEIRQKMYYTQPQEKTKTSCGVLAVENLVAVCYQSPQQNVTTLEQIKTFRLEHIQLMQSHGKVDYYQRQKNNKPTVVPAFVQEHYFQAASNWHLTKAEWQQVEKIQNNIQKLMPKNQEALIEALQQPIDDGVAAHRDYLTKLRNVFHEFCKLAITSNEQDALNPLIQELFHKKPQDFLQHKDSDFKISFEILSLIGQLLALPILESKELTPGILESSTPNLPLNQTFYKMEKLIDPKQLEPSVIRSIALGEFGHYMPGPTSCKVELNLAEIPDEREDTVQELMKKYAKNCKAEDINKNSDNQIIALKLSENPAKKLVEKLCGLLVIENPLLQNVHEGKEGASHQELTSSTYIQVTAAVNQGYNAGNIQVGKVEAIGFKQETTIERPVLKDKLPSVWSLPAENPQFFNRKLATEIAERMATRQGKDSNRLVLVAMSGLGGVGKTELAKYYIHNPPTAYTARLWFNANTREQLETEYRSLAQELNFVMDEKTSNDDIKKKLHTFLAEHPGWLMVVDNADEMEKIQPLLPIQGGDILITSRQSHWLGEVITIDVLEETEAIAFYKKLSSRKDDDESIKALVKELGYLPLAIAQAAAYVKRSLHVNAQEYLKLFNQHKAEILRTNKLPAATEKEKIRLTIATTWNLSLEAIEQKYNSTDEARGYARTLLTACAYLDSRNIPISLLQQYLKTVFSEKTSELTLNEAIDNLTSYSLIQADNDFIHVHKLVRKCNNMSVN